MSLKIEKQTIKTLLENIANSEPTPGGGAAAAISGAMAASLTEMVSNLTLHKKGYEKVYQLINKIMSQTRKARKRLIKLADDDIKAFDQVILAYRSKNQDRIQKALQKATLVPLETAEICQRVAKTAKELAAKGNKNAYSDAKSAYHLARAAKLSALENVKINLSLIKDSLFKKKIEKSIHTLK